MTRRPGYDIDGQPTKVDPRDFPDPLQVDPDGEPQRGDPPRPARGDWGCSVFALSLLLAVVAGCSAQPAGNATPSAAPENRMGDVAGRTLAGAAGAAQGQRGAPQYVSGPVVSHSADRVSAVPHGGAPPPLTLAAVTYSGRLAWASPSHGPRYLALREPVGTRVEICSMARCRERVSTDFGPIRSLWLSGRIADISAADFEYVCGMSAAQRIRHGLCPGSIRIISRPKIRLPQTSTEGP